MLQAIEEGFIKDVLKNYTTYQISYEIARKSEDNPDYEETPATIALKAFHDNHKDTINKKDSYHSREIPRSDPSKHGR